MDDFGLNQIKHISINNFRIHTSNIKIGETLEFSFNLTNKENKDFKLRVDYAVFYVKAGGQLSKKVFRLTENIFITGKAVKIQKKQRFTDFTTRKHYPGKHYISIIVNGKECAKKSFLLTH